MNIDEIKKRICGAFTSWAERKITELASGNPHMGVIAPYLKRGAENWVNRERERIGRMLDNASLFVADKDGDINLRTVTDDMISVFREMDEAEFGDGMVHGTAGKGVIKVGFPDNPIVSLLFGDGCMLKITADDLAELRDMMLEK